jgi:hypothetical protein
MSILAKWVRRVATFVVLDIVAIGMGMGVPIFAILLGFPVGWFLPAVLAVHPPYTASDLRSLLRAALLTSAITLALCAVLWLPTLALLFDPSDRIAEFGMPLILFEPLPSFIGWLVLMVLVSPVLQALATLCGSFVRLALAPRSSESQAAA